MFLFQSLTENFGATTNSLDALMNTSIGLRNTLANNLSVFGSLSRMLQFNLDVLLSDSDDLFGTHLFNAVYGLKILGG
jgi:hypothetical protein